MQVNETSLHLIPPAQSWEGKQGLGTGARSQSWLAEPAESGNKKRHAQNGQAGHNQGPREQTGSQAEAA